MKTLFHRTVPIFVGAVVILGSAVLSAAPLEELPQPYLFPAGSSTLTLFGLNVGAATGSFDPLTNFLGANPNENLLFDGGIGVRYTNGSGQQVDSGIGLYSSNNQLSTNGLMIRYAGSVHAADVTLTLANFGLTSGSASFDPTQATPRIIIESGIFHYFFNAAQIFPFMHFQGTVPDNFGGNPVDLWTVNLGDLLLQNGINDPSLGTLPIGDIILAANDSPIQNVAPTIGPSYFFVTSTVPEPGSALLVLCAMGAFFMPRTRSATRS